MKFPGQRKSKHYFPVNSQKIPNVINEVDSSKATHIIGIDQTLVDIEAKISEDFLLKFGLKKGGSSLISDELAEKLNTELKKQNLISNEFAGGTIGNTLHNYSLIADNKSVLLGVMTNNIKIGSYAYRYLCNTSSRVDLNNLQGITGDIGRCFALITEDGERTFAINKGKMNFLFPESIPEAIFVNASALVLTSYLLRCSEDEPISKATLKAIDLAQKYNIPIVLTLGTSFIISDAPEMWQDFLKQHITVVAMNEDEAFALTGEKDPLLATKKTLEWVDLVLCTTGPEGLFMAGYTDDSVKRHTRLPLLPGSIPEFNMYEFSRPMCKRDCENPIQVFSHISPYMGGPERIKNTNGAGDGALSAVLHDMSANIFHKTLVPGSSKHRMNFLTYSSFSQVCKYANRVSYEVLAQNSPRLSRGLPEKEDSLEEVYWDR